ncbi:hypothetical protein MMC14_005075 [Varicellaria rhodocarpa]|nr:hypothetical protein [Varicellaria rhodocarpa]
MSSHPAACLAMAKVFGDPSSNTSKNLSSPSQPLGSHLLPFIHTHAASIIASSPIPYVKSAILSGTLFNSFSSSPNSSSCLSSAVNTSRLSSTVNTNFHIDHTDPLEALKQIRLRERERKRNNGGEQSNGEEQEWNWPLGELGEGEEFLLIVQGRRMRVQKTQGSANSR